MKGLLTSCCLHWKILVGLGMVGLAIGIVAPGTLAAAIPLLIVAICPLSMIYGMRGMMGSGQQNSGQRHSDHAHGEEPAGTDRAAQLRAELDSIDTRAATVADQLRTSEPVRPARGMTELSGTAWVP
jgi:hypothetical protein